MEREKKRGWLLKTLRPFSPKDFGNPCPHPCQSAAPGHRAQVRRRDGSEEVGDIMRLPGWGPGVASLCSLRLEASLCLRNVSPLICMSN